MSFKLGPLTVLAIAGSLAIAEAAPGPGYEGSGPMAQTQTPPPAAPNQVAEGAGVDASSVFLPCTPVAAYWTGPPPTEGMPPGPALAIVDIDVRPKDARLYLDDRFVGRARYLDGRPGYLYLAPGAYHLELRLDGYETVAVDVEAEAGCRFDLKHRLERVKGTPKEHKADTYGKGKPFNRVFAPLEPAEAPESASLRGGPDPTLRPDIGSPAASEGRRSSTGAALKLSVIPPASSVVIDGEFAATAQELMRMEGPLAVATGTHRIEISAPGYRSFSRTVELQDGQVLELSVDLTSGADGAQ